MAATATHERTDHGGIEPLSEVAALESALDALGALDPTEMPGAQLSESIVALQRGRDRLEGLQARMVSAWDANCVWGADGARSGAAWLIQRARLPQAVARGIVSLARRLRGMARTERALCSGEIGAAQARRLARAYPKNEDAFVRDEETLVEHAASMRYSDFDRSLTYWEQLADPDGAEAAALAQDDARRAHLSKTFAGTRVLDALFDAVSGSIFSRVLSDIEDELFEADWREAKARLGEKVRVEDLARTPAQRRLDALVVMAIRAATAPEDGQVPRLLFTVLVDYPTLTGRVCELSDGTPLTPGQLVPWLTSADVERVVFGARSRVIDVSVRRRLFTGATRRAVEVRDRYCTGFGCEEPPERCDVDHVVPYSEGGPTEQANGRLACPHHNPGRRKTPGAGPDPPV